ncbi:efflux transporter outer membrane subunit [Bordetella hinzii]|uniref:TolC family protein n=1 Tax=Bordetella hinzii TaxID=103855 RepID=A0AAN1RWU7_9BORD|nr:TolC family protein [Bordetella hinzii]AKQ57046.1 Toluene efflux pump outer membrane protein TtgI precursor [Bordetella hinzii]AKQ61512.1 Toluene efflux pump outer membrane protein TtgI precursor [Bordetella hinzii]AZW17522.1 TolC family protein [Bordetella hinzii]KCB28233.1 efflux transporter, outer membrane factor lipoprotein, NodT family [Bordetella hinzii L60]KCB46566.1 efflux transporter, outer membrane factor lipoprotein, NodT family [Bordetella hinzii 4161]
MHHKFSVFRLAPLLWLAGCAVGPDYQAPRPEPVALASPEQALFTHERVQRDWWKQLQDPQLDRLVALALARNQDIRLAQARLAEARAVLDERELDRWPAVTAQGDYARSLSQLNAGPAGQRNLARSYQAGFDAVWEIDLFGRLRRAAESAAAASQASEADLAQIRVVVAAEVARNYFEMRGAEQRLRVARDSLASQRDTLRIVQALADSGRGNESDVASARAELATVEASLPVQETARRLAAYRLAVLAGLRPAELGELEPAPSLAPLATRLPIGDPARLLARRPDVRAAERALAAANAEVGVAAAERYPRIDLGGFLGFAALRGADFGTGASRAFSTRAGISWPALHLPTALARQRAAQARFEGSSAQYEQTVLRAIEELESALTQYGQTQRRLRSLAEAAGQSARALALATLRYQEGAAPYLAVLDAQRTLLRAQDAVAEAEMASYTSLAALYKALGGGWEPGMG